MKHLVSATGVVRDLILEHILFIRTYCSDVVYDNYIIETNTLAFILAAPEIIMFALLTIIMFHIEIKLVRS